MGLLDAMKKKNYIENTKGSRYYRTTYQDNLDVFTMLSRYHPSSNVIQMFHRALLEDETLALANLLYLLDIRKGKGERLLFQTIYRDLCENRPDLARKILPWIPVLGRYDYLLIGLDTEVEEETINLIRNQLEQDKDSNHPSLLAKWLPSHRTHNQNSEIAKKLRKKLNLSEKEYRKLLGSIRNKLNLIEKNLTEKTYEKIDFSEVPAKAMLKYHNAYYQHLRTKLQAYQEQVRAGKEKINTTGLFAYEIIQKIIFHNSISDDLYQLMWENQKDILEHVNANILVVADTSGSMLTDGAIPYATAIGLALYTAERNHGIFHNHFITFSSNPILQEVKGNTIQEKVANIECIVDNTDIDKVFTLILDASVENHLKQEDMPSHILIISDMEFDEGVLTHNGTNLEGWKKAFLEKGYQLPVIIFWNVATRTFGVPATKFDQDVAMISGFSTNVLENLLTLENYQPQDVMLEKLESYLQMLKEK